MKFQSLKNKVKGFTSGPWEISAYDSGHSKYEMNIHIVAGDCNDTVCDLDSFYRVTANESVALDEGMSDANLLVAAPNMFAALESIYTLHRKVPIYMDMAGDCAHGLDCNGVEAYGESMCPDSIYGYTCEYCSTINTEEYPEYPCETIGLIEKAL